MALGRTSGPFARVNAPIPQLTPVESTVQLTLNGTVEHLQIIVNMDHPRVTELSVRLTAPSGMTSVLAKLRGFALSMSLGTSATSYSATVAAFSRCANAGRALLRRSRVCGARAATQPLVQICLC